MDSKKKKTPGKALQVKLDQKKRHMAEVRAQNKKFLKVMADPDKSYHEAGGHGINVLANAHEAEVNKQNDAVIPTASSTLSVTVEVQDRSISYLAMGIILRAIKRGLMTTQLNFEYPYYSFRYLIEAFTSAAQSGVSIITEAPMWYWEIFHAIKPKIANFKTASIQYKWQILETGLGNEQVFNLGLGQDNYAVYWGTGATGSSVNGFPVLGPAPLYTSELGLATIASLWSFCSATTTPLIPDPGDKCATFGDTSMFAVTYPELGASFNSPGAFRTTIYSERHIDSPLFAKFGIYQPPGTSLWRGWHKAGLGGGSASMIGPQIIDICSDKRLMRNKIAPTIKVYNFDEIFE